MTFYADLASLPEDKRIEIMVTMVKSDHKTIAFIVEDKKKADRYIGKIMRRFPEVIIMGRLPSLVDETITIKIGPKPQ